MSERKGDVRWRAASVLRLVSRAAILMLAVALFYGPLRQVMSPWVLPTVQRLLPGGARGFLLVVGSHPPGARVAIDGEVRGTTPAILNVACREGQEVALTAKVEGFPDFRRVIPCREGQTLRARIRMGD